MAIRRVRRDFCEVPIGVNTTVAEIMPNGSTQMTAMEVDSGDYVVISAEDAKQRKAEEFANYISNQASIIRGSVRSEYLDKDLRIANQFFFSEFEDYKPMIVLGEETPGNPYYIDIMNFPLPEKYRTSDGKYIPFTGETERILMIIDDYPANGPFGIHLHNKSPNYPAFKKALQGHHYSHPIGHKDDDYARSIEALEDMGFRWTCFHYSGAQWKFNRKNIKKGDCLSKYFENLYAALTGAHHPVL